MFPPVSETPLVIKLAVSNWIFKKVVENVSKGFEVFSKRKYFTVFQGIQVFFVVVPVTMGVMIPAKLPHVLVIP